MELPPPSNSIRAPQQGPPAFQPAPPQSTPPERVTPPPKRAGGVIVGGAFVAGLATTVVFAVVAVIHFGKSHPAAVDKTPIVLPSQLNGFQDELDVLSKLGGDNPPT